MGDHPNIRKTVDMSLIKVGVPEKFWLAPLPAKFQKGFTYEDEALYYITANLAAPKIAQYISSRVGKCELIDAFAGIGGDSIGFAPYFSKIYSTELDAVRYYCLSKNIQAYHLSDRVFAKNADFCKTYQRYPKSAVVYMDPPWGGVAYSEKRNDDLPVMKADGGTRSFNELCCDLLEFGFPVIFAKVPTNFNTSALSVIADVKESLVFKKILMLEVRPLQSASRGHSSHSNASR